MRKRIGAGRSTQAPIRHWPGTRLPRSSLAVVPWWCGGAAATRAHAGGRVSTILARCYGYYCDRFFFARSFFLVYHHHRSNSSLQHTRAGCCLTLLSRSATARSYYADHDILYHRGTTHARRPREEEDRTALRYYAAERGPSVPSCVRRRRRRWRRFRSPAVN